MASRKTLRPEEELLARRMWNAYVRAQAPDERSDYSEWDALATRDPDTQRGFLGVARMVLRERELCVRRASH